MAKFGDKNYATIWLKPKTKKVFKGENKGEEYEVLQGTVDMGAGKMLTIEVYADLNMRDTKDGPMLPVKARKWKGTPKTTQRRGKSW